jgi:formate hydrogenlyase transcriptional activator
MSRRLCGGEILVACRAAVYHAAPSPPPVRSMSNKKVGTQAVGQQRTEVALQESEERFRLAFEKALVGMAVAKLDLQVRQVNSAFCRLVGYSQQELRTRSLLELAYPEDTVKVSDLAQRLSQGEAENSQVEHRYLTKDGKIIYGRLCVLHIPDSPWEAAYILAILKDYPETRPMVEPLSAAPEQEITDLLLKVQRLKDQVQAEHFYQQEEIRLAHDFDQIVGSSIALKQVLRQAQQVAPTDTTVLILGETGTGKELLAQAIHSLSVRCHRTLVKVNCAALPPTLIESELFGHEKGSFTGANTSRTGRFELANGATLFLDEIGELPLELQAKLLRVLQEGEFERLGSSRTIKVDVRVIAATNQDLEEAVRTSKFRADLFYRLNVFPIWMPALQERREDIPLLTQFFVEQISQRLGKRFEKIAPEELEALEAYRWPGNIRELRNVIERAMIIAPDGKLRLRNSLRINQAMELSPESVERVEHKAHEARIRRLEEIEREHILRVLEQTYWRVEGKLGAAVVLGLNPGTLRSRMKKLGIQRPTPPG